MTKRQIVGAGLEEEGGCGAQGVVSIKSRLVPRAPCTSSVVSCRDCLPIFPSLGIGVVPGLLGALQQVDGAHYVALHKASRGS